MFRDRGAYVGSDLAEAGLGNRLDDKVRWQYHMREATAYAGRHFDGESSGSGMRQ